MSETASSKSQDRAMKLLGLARVSTYAEAASALATAGCIENGIPAGETWRTAAKLSEFELLAAIRVVGESEFCSTTRNLDGDYG